MSDPGLLVIVLAAGKGTRMVSRMPKVLHPIAGRSMLGHVLSAVAAMHPGKRALVVGPDMEGVAAEAERIATGIAVFLQPHQRGTADAVLAARPALAAHAGDVLIVYADTPLVEAATLGRLVQVLKDGAGLAVLGFEARDPSGYGRLIAGQSGALLAIREERDATSEERAIRLCNSGMMAFRAGLLPNLLDRISNDNAKGEFYLTDAVAIAHGDGLKTSAVTGSEDEVLGVNSRADLAAAEALWQRAMRRRVQDAGATLVTPETVWFSFDTLVGRDVVIEPNVVFGPGVVVEDDVRILAHCHIEGARIRERARVGPFARLRPGADIGPDAHIGNFVEVKNTALGKGAKANHLAYLGDGAVGVDANIGAGTIFCNYDGFFKHRTEIGDGAFVGSNSALVAPVRIGDGAYIGSGSVITKDVAPDALALERSAQEERPGWAAKFRAMMARRKARAG